MEDRMMKFYSKESNMLALHAMHGHFATSHSHINYYVDVTSIKTRVAEAKTGGTCTVFENSKDKIRGYHCVYGWNGSGRYLSDGGDPAGRNYGHHKPA